MKSTSAPNIPVKLPDPPRMIQRRKDTVVGTIIVRSVFGVMMTVGIVLIGRDLLYRWVGASGLAVTALIDSKNVRLNHDKGGSHVEYFLQYHFNFAGSPHTDKQQVPLAVYDSIDPPTLIPARAMRIASWTICVLSVTRADTTWMPGLFLFGVTVVISVTELIYLARQRYLVREGTAVPGQVLSRRISRGKNTSYHMKYRFTDKDGSSFERECSVRQKVFNAMTVGTAVTVLHDPGNPKRNLAYECCPFEVVPAVGSSGLRL